MDKSCGAYLCYVQAEAKLKKAVRSLPALSTFALAHRARVFLLTPTMLAPRFCKYVAVLGLFVFNTT